MTELDTTDLTIGSTFRFGYLASLAVFLPFLLACGISGAFGGRGTYLNGHAVHGVRALVVTLVLALLFPLFGATILSLGTVVLRIVRRGPVLRTRG